MRFPVIAAALLAMPAPSAAQGNPPTRPPQTRPPVTRPAPRTPPFRFITVTVGAQHVAGARADDGAPEIYAEPAFIRTSYASHTGRALDVGAGFLVRGRLGIAATAGFSQSRGRVHVDASIPSPILFERHRAASADDRTVRTALDVDIDAWWLLANRRRWWIAVGGGASVTHFQQDLETDLRLDDRFPFDEVSIREIVLTRFGATTAGGSVVARSAFMLSRRVGLEADVRWRALVPAVFDAGRRVEVPTGGLRAGGGLHVRF